MFGKTKFPGKPSKLVHKKRISVLSCDNNSECSVDERREIDDGKNLASENNNHGFQVCLSLIYAKKVAHFVHFRREFAARVRVHCRNRPAIDDGIVK